MPAEISYDSSGARVTCTLEARRRRPQTYSGELKVCSSPFCHCSEIQVSLAPVVDCSPQGQPSAGARLLIDPFDRKCEHDPEGKGRTARELARLLQAQLRDDDWECLSSLFWSRKGRALDSLDPSGASHLPFAEVEAEGTMLAYGEVLPFGKQRSVEHSGLIYLVDDQYCVRTRCKCAQGVVTFIPRTQEDVEDPEHIAISIDLRKKRWLDIETGSRPTGDARRLVAALRNQHPGALRWLKERRALLRKIYRSSKRAHYDRE